MRLLGGSSDKSEALKESCRHLLNQITPALAMAIKDNDLIYHDAVPNADALDAVERLEAVKPLSFSDICVGGEADIARIVGPDIFSRLVPLSVHESASMYSEEKAGILRKEQGIVASADQELDGMLESMHVIDTFGKLKRALKGGDVGYALSDEAVGWSASVRDAADCDELVRVLEAIKDKLSEQLNETGLLLDKEHHECESMRTKYGEKWTQSHSAGMTANMRKDLSKNRDAFSHGSGNDDQLVSRFASSKRVIDILRQPFENVEVIFAAEVNGNTVSNAPLLIDAIGGGFNDIGEQVQVDKLEALVQRIKLLKRERAEVVQDLKQRVSLFN